MAKRPPKGEAVQAINTLLVDGNALFKVGFFGAKDEYNYRGEHIGGVYQFLTMMRKLLNEDLYHRAYVFWDGKLSGQMRFKIYSEYKGDRDKDFINGTHPVDASEVRQKRLIWDYLENLCIRQLRHDVVESDDLIAYYCQHAQKNEKITICTNDRDLCQLISDNVKIYFCDLKAYVDIANYTSYFCHHQSNAALIKTITGDNSDCIKGVKGVKETKLLSFFPQLKERNVSLNEIITRAKELQQIRIENKLPPLTALDNIINGVTLGVQGDKLYEINNALVNLKKPMITSDAIEELNVLKEGYFEMEDRGIKNVLIQMKKDGLDKTIGTERYAEYLLPFKKLMEREFKHNKNTIL